MDKENVICPKRKKEDCYKHVPLVSESEDLLRMCGAEQKLEPKACGNYWFRSTA